MYISPVRKINELQWLLCLSLASGRVHPPFENGVLLRGWSQVSSCLNTLLSGTNGWDPLFRAGIYLCSSSYISNQRNQYAQNDTRVLQFMKYMHP